MSIKSGKEWQLSVPGRPDITRLKKRLLKRAGKRFQRNSFLSAELSAEWVKLLIEQGRFFTEQVVRKKMEMSCCHVNALTLVKRLGYRLCGGVALSDDGIWRVHSWCLNHRGKIVETTLPRTVYFGWASAR